MGMLDDAWSKLARARHHFDLLRPQVEAFEQRDNHSFSFKIDPQEGKYTFHVHGLETPDPDWGLIIGDCVHNARSALDHLMVRLVALTTGTPPQEIDYVTFPIATNPGSIRIPKAVRDDLSFRGYLTRIEELQPFNAGNPSIWGRTSDGLPIHPRLPAALHRLSTLDVIDKHRVIHAVWLSTKFEFVQPFPGIPSDYQGKGSSASIGPLVEGTEVGSLSFESPLPSEWKPSQMDMKSYFKLQVALYEPLPFQGVLEVLRLCMNASETTLKLFEPVFSQGGPPLPVTSSLTKYDLDPLLRAAEWSDASPSKG